MSVLKYAVEHDVTVNNEVDVAVIGGGPGGIGAAVMAARAGAKTILVERYSSLGGMAYFGEVHPFMSNHADKTCMDKPVYVEWVEKMHNYLALSHPMQALDSVDITPRDRNIHKEYAMLAAEDVCLAAGVELLYHHTPIDVIRNGGSIDALILHSKGGLTALRAKQFVDCTGDGDIAAMAGCEFEVGGDDGFCQPMTLCFKLEKVKCESEGDWLDIREAMQKVYLEAKENGEIECPRENVLAFKWVEPGIVHFNTTRVVMKSGVSGAELSEAEIIGRRQLRQLLTLLRDKVPVFKDCEVRSIAHHIGIRETRRIKGIKRSVRDDFINRAKYDDAIARVSYSIDIHSPTGAGTELVYMSKGDWYEIPYGCVVAADIDNLTVGGRPISSDHAIHSSFRVMPPACSIGQAAGMGAAMAVAAGVLPRELDGVEVRRNLKEQGAWL